MEKHEKNGSPVHQRIGNLFMYENKHRAIYQGGTPVEVVELDIRQLGGFYNEVSTTDLQSSS